LEYWKLHVDVVTEPSEVKRVFADRHRAEHPTRATRIGDGRVLQSDYAWQAIQAAWEGAGYSPVLSLKPEHAEYGQRYLAGHGVPVGSWFVTFHIRENGFHRDSYGNLRSCNAASYVPAMERVVAHGGWVCRVGDNTMTPLPNLPNLIDATRLAKRDEILDLFLIATARFMVCSTSGPSCIAVCFGTPQIFTNVFPLTERALGRANRFTPKTYRDVATGNLVPFSVAMKEFKLGSDNSGVVREKGIEVIDNTSEEIVEAVEEMITLSSGRDPNDNMTKLLQDSYDALCPASIPISHSRIAGSFIRRHAGLL
jgi:putative glycosyltransferase (TIGR04372 family)